MNDIQIIMSEFSKYAQQENDLQAWESCLKEASTPVPDGLAMKAAKLALKGVTGMAEAAKSLKDVSEQDINKAIVLGQRMGAVRGSYIDIEQINKFASNFQSMNKTAQTKAVKALGGGLMSVIPIVGFVFSFVLALKNLIYGFVEYRKLTANANEVGLKWYETLFAVNLIEKTGEFKENPVKLENLAVVSKNAKCFADEAISFGANFIDFVKDVAFMILGAITVAGSAIMPAGLAATLGVASIDIGLSFIFAVFEYYAEEAAFRKFDDNLTAIVTIAESKISIILGESIPDEVEKPMSYDEMMTAYYGDSIAS